MEEYGIKNILIKNNIIFEDKILNEELFLDFLLGLFLYYFSYERYRYFFGKSVNEALSLLSKGKKSPFSPLPCPFRFVGVEDKTLFIAEMGQAHLFFKETLTSSFFNSFSLITYGNLILNEKGDASSWKKHECPTLCEQCKKDFSSFASKNLNSLCSGMGINSYILLNVNAELFKGLISPDEFIEISQQEPRCSCNEHIYSHQKHCQYCGTKIDKKLFAHNNKPGNPEKIFNEALAVYLSMKKGYDYKSNHTEDDLFNEETDIFLFKESKIKIIEGTVKMELDKSYVIDKTKTLALIEKLLKRDVQYKDKQLECDILIWGINEPLNKIELEEIPKRIFHEDKRIWIISSGISINDTNRLEINITELNNLQSGFKKVISNILENI